MAGLAAAAFYHESQIPYGAPIDIVGISATLGTFAIVTGGGLVASALGDFGWIKFPPIDTYIDADLETGSRNPNFTWAWVNQHMKTT